MNAKHSRFVINNGRPVIPDAHFASTRCMEDRHHGLLDKIQYLVVVLIPKTGEVLWPNGDWSHPFALECFANAFVSCNRDLSVYFGV